MHTVVLSELQFPHLWYGDLIPGLQGGGENCDIMHAEYSVECLVCRKCSARSQLLSTRWPWDDSDELLTTSEGMPCWCSLGKPEWSCPGRKQLVVVQDL